MICMHSRKLIFIKTKKTAGTSLELALRPFCASGDIITTITSTDEKLHFKGKRPQNYSTSRALELSYKILLQMRQYRLAGVIRKYGRKYVNFYNHMPAARVKDLIGETDFNSSYKFAVERHPYEKVISRAWHRINNRKDYSGISAEGAVDRVLTSKSLFIGWPQYSDGKKLLVDKVLRYENLSEELQALENMFGMHGLVERLPKAKSNFRKDRTRATDILNDRQKKRVQELCEFEFKLMDYET